MQKEVWSLYLLIKHDDILAGNGKFTYNTSTILNKMINYIYENIASYYYGSCLSSTLVGMNTSKIKQTKQLNNRYIALPSARK